MSVPVSQPLIADRLKPVAIPDLLRMADQTLRVGVEGHYPELVTLTPVVATLSLHHQGTFLAIAAEAETIITLACDRCLGQYNHRLQVDSDEVIWLKTDESDLPAVSSDEWIESEDLMESVSAQGKFDLAQWLYEQLCLALPIQQLCDQSCVPPSIESDQPYPAKDSVDHRWAALAKLQEQLSNS